MVENLTTTCKICCEINKKAKKLNEKYKLSLDQVNAKKGITEEVERNLYKRIKK